MINHIELEKLANLEGTPYEFQRIKAIYPFLKFSYMSDKNYIRVDLSKSGSWNCPIEQNRWGVSAYNHCLLSNYNLQKKIESEVSSKFPNLTVMAHIYPNDIKISLWTKSGYGMKDISYITEYAMLESLNNDAGQADQDGWFYCTYHQRPEKKSEGFFNHFAGYYCDAVKTESPDIWKRASTETYE